MEESKTQTKQTKTASKSNGSCKTSKARTHIPVEGYTIEKLREYPLEELLNIAKELEVENPQELKRQELMFSILKSQID